MAPRRSHRKSRAGCQRCKRRKIKCDELRPRCGNCAKHGVLCDFEHPEVLEQLATELLVPAAHARSEATSSPSRCSTAVATTASRQDSPPPPCPPPPKPPRPIDRLMELKLLHHYVTNTSKTLLIDSPAHDDVWQRAVPEVAFGSKNYLMNAILSVAALHLRTQQRDDKSLAEASHALVAATLEEYRAALNAGITAGNAEALFLTSSLITFQATVSRVFLNDDSDDAEPGTPPCYLAPMPLFHAFQGVKTVITSSWQWLQESDIAKVIIDSQPSFHLDLNPGPTSFFGHLLDDLDRDVAGEPADQLAATRHGYAHAVSVLNWAHKNICAPATLAFPATVSRRFVQLVDEKRPRALAVLACFFALLKRIDKVWWLGNAADREVTAICHFLEHASSPWARHLGWALRIARWEGHDIPPDVWGTVCEEQPAVGHGAVETMMSHIDLIAGFTQRAHTGSIASDGKEPSLKEEALD